MRYNISKITQSLLALFILALIFIFIYRYSFYTPILIDHGKRNFIEKTIDFFWFGYHYTKASIYTDYLPNKVKKEKEYAKAGWYRKNFLVKAFGIDGDSLFVISGTYKDLNIDSILEDLYIHLIKEKNPDISFLREAGKKLLQCKNWEMAAEAFSKITYSNSNDVMANYYSGLSYLNLNIISKAKQYFMTAKELSQDFADVYFRLGTISEKEKNLKEAQIYYEKASNILPNHLDSLKALQRINRKLR